MFDHPGAIYETSLWRDESLDPLENAIAKNTSRSSTTISSQRVSNT